MATQNPTAPECPCEEKRHSQWERRTVIYTLAGCLWATLVFSAVMTVIRVPVPSELYYLASGSFGALALLLSPSGGKDGARKRPGQ